MRIVTFNIAEQELSESLLKRLDTLQPEIILLQEVEEYTAGKTNKIASLFGYNSIYESARNTKYGTHGLAILTKGEISDLTVLTLPFIKLIPKARNRIALLCNITVKNEQLQVCNIHLDTRLNAAERTNQLAPVLDKLNEPAILAGDFNSVPLEFYKTIIPIKVSKQRKYIEEQLLSHGFDLSAKYKGRSFRPLPWQLDAIYPLGVKLNDYGVYKKIKLSDHYPVWADIF